MQNILVAKRRVIFLAAGWSLFLVFLALQPEAVALFFLRHPRNFVLAHIGAYGVLSFLICISFRFQRELCSFRAHDAGLYAVALLFCFLWGAVTEGVQIWTRDRGPDLADLQADLAGALLGILFFSLLRSMSRKFRKNDRGLPFLKRPSYQSGEVHL